MSGYNPEEHGASQSMLGDFAECKQKARFRCDGVTSIAPYMPFAFGTVGHDVLDMANSEVKSGRLKPGKIPGEKRIKRWIDQANKNWRKENPLATTKSLDVLELACGYAEAVFSQYFRFWSESLHKMEWLEVEKFFKIDVKVSGYTVIPFMGRRDGAFYEIVDGKKELWLWESKFMSRINEDQIVDTTPLSLQNNGYIIALEEETGEKVKGVCYNISRRPGLYRRKEEKLSDYVERMKEDVAKRPEFYFFRFRFNTDRKEIKNTKADLQGLLLDFVKWFKGERMHYRSTNACKNQYGTCNYLPICANDDWTMFRKKERKHAKKEPS